MMKKNMMQAIFMLVVMATTGNVLAADAYVNFQPSGSAVPSGYVKDVGDTYTVGRGYGWGTGFTGSVHARTQNADPRLNTFVIVNNAQPKWVYDIANGDYKVTLSAGDAQAAQGPHLVAVEGTTVIDNQSTAGGAFITVTDHSVTVTNGQLYITIGGNGANNTALNYVDIVYAGANIIYTDDEFIEAHANNGAIDNSSPVLINLVLDTFTGSTNALFAASNYTVTNLPAGLSVVMTNVSSTQLSMTLSGSASLHADSNSVADLTVTFKNGAFTGGDASIVNGASKSDINVVFRNEYFVNQNIGDDDNNGSANDIANAWKTITNAVAQVPINSIISIMTPVHTESNIVISSSILLKGQGADETILQAATNKWSQSGRVFTISGTGKNVIIQDMMIRYGDYYKSLEATGGAIYAGANNLTVERCAFVDNRARALGNNNSFGGAIYGTGDSYALKDSVFVGNLAAARTGGQHSFGGALCLTSADVVIQNCTFSDNESYSQGNGGAGGAVYVEPGAGKHANVYNSTFINNHLTVAWGFAGGGYNGGSTNQSTVISCLFADNVDSGQGHNGSAMSRTAFKNCVYEGTLYDTIDQGDNTHTNDAKVNTTLADNGGPTMTHALLAGSPAIGAGSNLAGLSNDQRGSSYNRTVDLTDCGAYEYLAGPIILAYSTNKFNEGALNNGGINNSDPLLITISIGYDSFTGTNGQLYTATEVAVTNLPAGLSIEIVRTNASTLKVELNGSATDNDAEHSISNFGFVFQDAAFSNSTADVVENSTKTNMVISFDDSADKSISYNLAGFSEDAATNDGSIDNTPSFTITMNNGRFAGTNGQDYAADVLVTVGNLPDNLTATITQTDSNNLDVALDGTAVDHNSVSNVTDLTFTFENGAFDGGGASSVSNYNTTNITITFVNPEVLWSGSFSETAANDGSINTNPTVTATLKGAKFAGLDGTALAFTSDRIPSTLVAVVTKTSDTGATVILTGKADDNVESDGTNDLEIAFGDAAFSGVTAAIVTNATVSDLAISFDDPPVTYYVSEIGDDNNVGTDVSPFKTIANALAQSDVEVVEILSGTITENGIVVSKGVIIRGQGADNTILQASENPGSGVGNIIIISAFNAVIELEDLTIRNGSMPNGQWGGGGAVLLNSSGSSSKNSTLIVNACSFENNSASGNGGGAIYVRLSALEVYDSTFFANSATNRYLSNTISGGAIYGRDLQGGRIVNSTFSGNSVKNNGGGIAISSTTGYTSEVYNCTFVTNTAGAWAGGIRGDGGVVVVESCLFADNVAPAGAAAMQSVSYSNTVYEGDVSTCTDQGGNLNVGDAKVDATLTDNGGSTMTHALLTASDAIGNGSNPLSLSYDQRGTGYARTIDATDCGAYEYRAGPIELVYSTNEFNEATLNDGSINNSSPMVITLTGDNKFSGVDGVFTPVNYSIHRLPTSLVAELEKTSDTTIEVVLTNNAVAHDFTDGITDLGIEFKDAAFTTGPASAVGNYSNGTISINFDNTVARYISYNTNDFFEASTNDGSIADSPAVTITLYSDSFTGVDGENFVTNNKVTITGGLSAGLTGVVTRQSESILLATLIGNATDHNSADDVNDLTFTFQNTAFELGSASSVSNSTNANLTITYLDPVLTYDGTGIFAENTANDGNIDSSFIITLVGDIFSGSVNDDFADGSGEVTLLAAPAGLSWKVNRDSDTQLTVSLTGTADDHNIGNNVPAVTLTFNDSAFENSTASEVTNNSKTDYSISYIDPALSYSIDTLYESSANDGKIVETITVTLEGDTFTGNNGDDFAGTEVLTVNEPNGLIPKVERVSATELILSFAGTASPHDPTVNEPNFTLSFQNSAFDGNDAAVVTNTPKSDISVLFRGEYFVNQSTGNDLNDGTSAGNAWKTLTNAVVQAPAGSIINIMASVHTESAIAVSKDMVFKGQGAKNTIVQANAIAGVALNRIFSLTGVEINVGFEDMTIRHGRSVGEWANGGAISASADNVTLLRCSLEDNEAEGIGGGAVYLLDGELTVRDCTFSGNISTNNVRSDAGSFGGAISAPNSHDVLIINSTFSDNHAKGVSGWAGGGGSLYIAPDIGYEAKVYNSTFVGNSVLASGYGGAIYGGIVVKPIVKSCLFAGNLFNGSASSSDHGSSMAYCSYSTSVYEGAVAVSSDLGSNLQTNDVMVELTLADNGGPTMTHALLAGSSAIDVGSNPAELNTDQRGHLYERVFNSLIDVGSYEFGAGPDGTLFMFR